MPAPHPIIGCPMTIGSCVTGYWIVGTTRVTSDGEPLVLDNSPGVCAPTGAPLVVVTAQTRVTAQ